MPEITPRHAFSTPSEFEEPYYETSKGLHLALDAATFANAENSQLQFMSTGTVGWDATASSPTKGVLFWSSNILASAFSTPFKAEITGPASVELADGEVLFFLMPRVMTANTVVQLYRANRIYLLGTRLHDLRLFCARFGDTLYFYNGKSLKDGDAGALFGGGLVSVAIYPPHDHLPPLVIEPPAIGVTLLNVGLTSLTGLKSIEVYRNGNLQSEPADYAFAIGTGIVTLVIPTAIVGERFIILRDIAAVTPTTTHAHLSALKLTPLVASTLLDMLVALPTLQGVDLFRNGNIQVEPDDYSLDPNTGFVTLVIPTVLNETFVALRRINI